MNAVAFHLAFPVISLEKTKKFYNEILGCELGRESERWVDFNFFGHQLSGHLVDTMPVVATNDVDGKKIPTSHFGAVLEWSEWEKIAEKLRDNNVEFLIEPYTRFAGFVGEQGTFFVLDPSGNGVEFKTFKDKKMIFEK
jgi:extradiol dioxygenase family protein